MGDACVAGACQAGPPRDTDGDSHVDPLCGGDDCNDANSQVWFVPFEVTNLLLATPTNLSWDSQGSLVGPETQYDLVSGPVGPLTSLNFSTGTCLQSNGPNSFIDARSDPAVDTSFWYLARARNSCGTGTYGTPQRDASIPACP